MFATHIVDNPDTASELSLLENFGPRVPRGVLLKLVDAFAEIRRLVDDGTLSYPYSTRELVSVVKHLERFPQDGLTMALRNVFDFDLHRREDLQVVAGILHRYGGSRIVLTSTCSTYRCNCNS